MPLSEQEQRCIDLTCNYLGEHYVGHWCTKENLDELNLSEPTPEVIVGNGDKTAAIEVKRLLGGLIHQNYTAYLRNNEKYLVPSCGGYYHLNPAPGFGLPIPTKMRRLIKREIERVAPTLVPGQKGTIRISRQGHVSLISESDPPFITCLHGGPYSEIMNNIRGRISGKFMLVDEGTEHSFITQECKNEFEEAVVSACRERLQGNIGDFGWYEEWDVVRIDNGDADSSEDGVWIMANTGAHSMPASVEQCVNAVLENAMRKFRRVPRWADLQIIVLETSLMAPASLAAEAVETFQSEDRKLISHFLILEGDDLKDASTIISSLVQEAATTQKQQQQYILESSISTVRVQKLKDDYLKGRRDIGATEKIFKYFGAFQRQNKANNLASFGFNVLLDRGPFVDNSNWLDQKGWEFAVAEERYLVDKVLTHLAHSVSTTGQMLSSTATRKPHEILGTAKKIINLMGKNKESLLVLAAHMDTEIIFQLKKELTTPDWELGDELRTNWILGKHENCPILYLKDSDLGALYVVDLPHFASLIQYDPEVDLHVLAIDEEMAIRILEDNPNIKLGIKALLSRVNLKLYQSYDLEIHDQKAVWAAKFSP